MLLDTADRPVQVRRNQPRPSQTVPVSFSVYRMPSIREILWTVLVIVLGVAAFSLEKMTKTGMAVGLMYALSVVFSSRLSYAHAPYIVATICSSLTLSGFFIGNNFNQIPWGEVTDRLLVLLAIWVAAFLSMLWEKPEWDSSGTRANQRRSPRPILRAEVTTPEGFVEPGDLSRENLDDLAQLNQSLLQKNYELETLINVVSHDLRSPLVNIQGFSKELSDSCDRLRMTLERAGAKRAVMADIAPLLDGEIPEALRYIRAGAEKINSVLSGILKFSRLGRLTLNSEPLNVTSLVCGIATVMEFQMKEKGVLLQIDDLPDCIGDEILVNQVFSNLIENAYKYLDPSRPGVIRVTGKIEDGKAIYAVEDNGIGIQDDYQGKIFEMFHRLEPKGGSGEGLGLTIVRRIVERHLGEVWVQSVFGEGTTFYVSFPSTQNVQKGGQS